MSARETLIQKVLWESPFWPLAAGSVLLNCEKPFDLAFDLVEKCCYPFSSVWTTAFWYACFTVLVAHRHPQQGGTIVAPLCGEPLSRYTYCATCVAADFIRDLGLFRCSNGIAPHPPQRALLHLSPFNCQGRRTSSWL